MTSTGLRIRLLESSNSVVTGGARLLIHGKGFRPAPHSLVVRFRLLAPDIFTASMSSSTAASGVPTIAATATVAAAVVKVDVPGKFIMESQLECVLPSFQQDAIRIISQVTKIPATSAAVLCSPLLLSVQVEVILDSEVVSNALLLVVHQQIVIQKLTPQYVLLASPTTMTATLNLLRLSNQSSMYPKADSNNRIMEISSLPVFVRVQQVSERTGAVSEQTREGKWKISSVGVYEVEFDAMMMGFGAATVEVTLNRSDFFRGKEKLPESLAYHVSRDMALAVVEPCCISVTSGRMTEVRILGEGFVDSGDLVVQLSQRELSASHENNNDDNDERPMMPMAQLNATFVNQNEIRCSVQPNMPFGLTAFHVSLNGGRQYGKMHVVALLHRDRTLESIHPDFGSLEGNALIAIRHACLTVEDTDSPKQILKLLPPKKIRVRFQAINDDGTPSEWLVKVVNAEMTAASAEERGLIRCRAPSFLEEMKPKSSDSNAAEKEKVKSDRDGDVVLRIKRFRVSLALGNDAFFGALDFGYYFPPVIRSITMHHGPIVGGTSMCLRMKFKVPPRLPILVRFLSLSTGVYETIPGVVAVNGKLPKERLSRAGSSAFLTEVDRLSSEQEQAALLPENNPAFLIYCTTPPWTKTPNELPHLTKVQVSYNGGIEFVPADPVLVGGIKSPRVGAAAGDATTISTTQQPTPKKSTDHRALSLIKDMSYLYFLFYQPPKLNAIFPMSADIHGGSYLRIIGDNVVDHGAQVTIVFQSPQMSRKVIGFIENGEVRCCAPPFNVGLAAIFVSLNSEQYTKCEFFDPETKKQIEYVFYNSPSLNAISPLCACISTSSVISIFGVNLIETGRIKVRFSFTGHHGKQVFKDMPGKARNGIIMAPSPLFASEYTDKHAIVDVALNGYDFSGTTVSLYYFSSYVVRRVEPATGAFEIPIGMVLHVTPQISSDSVQIRVRFKHKYTQSETVFGPVDVVKWTANRIEFELPAPMLLIDSLDALESALIDISFDRAFFHNIGELLQLYKVYNIPHLTSMSPLYGPHDKATEVMARGVNLRESDVVKISLYLERSVRKDPVVIVQGRVNQKRQTLIWQCPALDSLLIGSTNNSGKGGSDQQGNKEDRMLLSQTLSMQISIIDGQQKPLPFTFRSYKSPRLLSMSPAVGYICSGSLISFEFMEAIETPTVNFRFGASQITAGRIRDDRFVECFSPELTKGVHDVAVSFNEQHYEFAYIEAGDEPGIAKAADDESGDEATTPQFHPVKMRVAFQAFALPLFTIPDNRDRIYAFGPITGGTVVHIKGRGFIAEAKIYVRFCSPFKSGFGNDVSEVIVKAKVLDSQMIQCVSPLSKKPGRVSLHVSYNLQQYTDSMCFFEYHTSTKFSSKGILCGPVSGGTPVTLMVQDTSGLPENRALVQCLVRFQSDRTGHNEDVEAEFDPETLVITTSAPAWPSNELVAMKIAMMRGASQQFTDSTIKFLFYDPPKGVINIEPSAGPVTGGTEVLAWCGKIVDTGEITVSITMYNDGELLRAHRSGEGSSAAPAPVETVDNAKPVTLLVKGKIVGEAVAFATPAVNQECVAYLNISLNGINYTSVHTKSTLRYIYYVEPVIRRIMPAWSSLESVNQILIAGDHLRNYGCKALVRFQLQNPEDKSCVTSKVVDACFSETSLISGDDLGASLGTLECSAQSLQPGFYEIEISLNGQQFSRSNYMNAKYGNYGGAACTALLPFRCFSAPFFLATPTGPAAGGSTVILFMTKKLAKILAKESKCQVQFAPLRSSDPMNSAASVNQKGGGGSSQPPGLDPIYTVGEIDHANGKITCRAPLLRSACAASLDVILPLSQETKTASTSTCTFFGVKDREKYYSYESPTIAEIAPSCGPTSGGTVLVIEGTNFLDTGQIFVRFRSSLNEREFVIIPGTYSRTFPDGSLSCSPLIICKTPPVEILDKVVTVESVSGNNSNASGGNGGNALNTLRHKDALTGRARMHTFQQLAEQSVRLHQRQGGSYGRTLKITRTVMKNSAKGNTIDATSNVNVLVDFTLNAGEQFIAHSVTFHYYVEADPNEITWFPKHLPTRTLDRAPLETRIITVQLPKTFRLSDAPERICFRFEGQPQPIFWKRRGLSAVLHETGVARELLMLDLPKFKTQSTMRRRSTYFRNSSISASSNNLLSDSGAGNVLSTSVRARPTPPGPSIDETSGKTPNKPASSIAPTAPAPSSSQATTPFIAGKVVRLSEVTCPIPDFSCPGAVRVFLSLNAQQFICLGEIHIHNPVSIKEDDKYRFCSNIGGDPFMLNCSPSTVFSYLLAQCVTNEERYNERMFNLATVKASKALVWAKGEDEECDSVDGSSGAIATFENTEERRLSTRKPTHPLLAQMSHRDSLLKSLVVSTAWREREFHVVQVHMVPPQMRLRKKVIVSVSRVDSQIEIGTSVPDDNGCCVFEMTDWGSEMLLKASSPLHSGYASYSAIICEGIAYRQKKRKRESQSTGDEDRTEFQNTSDGDSGGEGVASNSHILMIQHAPKPALRVVVFCSSIERISVKMVAFEDDDSVQEAELQAEEGDAALLGNMQLCSFLVHPEQPNPSHKMFNICVKFQNAESSDDRPDRCDIQVAMCDHAGVKLFLSGIVTDWLGAWAVASVLFEPEGVQITSIDRFATSLEELTVIPSTSLVPGSPTQVKATTVADQHFEAEPTLEVQAKSRTVSVSIWFACADSSRNLSCSSEARLILPGSIDLATFMGAPLLMHEVKLECAMPELPFSGPAVLMVTFAGVTFSNSICIQCYDPRTWRITSLDPPCGLVHKDMLLRVEGENFVENRKILVRLSDAVRYFNVNATVEKIHLLILRVAAIKNLKSLLQSLGIPSFMPGAGASSSTAAAAQKREEEATLPFSSVSNFTLTLRIECGKQTEFATCREASLLALLSSMSALSWEEQYEIQVFSKQNRILLTLEISDTSLPKPIEIARAVASLDTLQDGVMGRKTLVFEEHFRKGRSFSGGSNASSPPSISSEIDLLLHLSPPMLNANVVVCKLEPLQTPQKLRVQISSGDSFYSSCEEIRNTSTALRGFSSWYQVYNLPKVVETTPKVLPRSAGGEILIHGSGFIECEGGKIIVRVFACTKHVLTGAEEHQVLGEVNRITRLEKRTSEFFMRDLEGRFVSPNQIACVIPPNLATYNVFYRLSFDGREFTEATSNSHLLLFSIDSIAPRGGPVSGNTYTALHGTNINACMSRWELVPTVRFKWIRGARELESVTVPGEYYHSEDMIYFYTPQSKFGLQNITVNVELCLCTKRELESASAVASGGALTTGSNSLPPPQSVQLRFGQDEVPFVMYKAPMIKLIAPTLGLVCGLSSLELIVQGLDDKAAMSLRHAHKTRFKRRGQMQVSDAHLTSGGKFVSLVPRFNVSSAVATQLPDGAMMHSTAVQAAPSPSSPQRHGTGAKTVTTSNSGPLKIWNRDSGIYVSLLRGRNLHVSKKHTCNPFAVLSCNKVRLKSTRKEGTFAPVWNEFFDFEWKEIAGAPPVIRVVIENQLTMDQSEIIGNVEINFAEPGEFSRAFSFRAWFPLRKSGGRNTSDAGGGGDHHQQQHKGQQHSQAVTNTSLLGEAELVISYIPRLQSKKNAASKLSTSNALKSSILSMITTKKLQQQQAHIEEALHKKKEKILSRLFRHHQGAQTSMVPNELLVELALNGQDFWSIAPHRCYLTPTPILVNVEPSFISISGGTQMHVFGMNFTNSGTLRIAFAFPSASLAAGKAAPSSVSRVLLPIDAGRVVVVDAKYRSSTCVSCVTPSLVAIAPPGNADVTIYVSTNGVDFESVSLPHQHTSIQVLSNAAVESDSRVEEDTGSGVATISRRRGEESAIVQDKDRYIVHQDRLVAPRPGSGSRRIKTKTGLITQPEDAALVLTRQVHLYLIPTIFGVKPSDGIYTSRLTIEGKDFTPTNVAVGESLCVLLLAACIRLSVVY